MLCQIVNDQTTKYTPIVYVQFSKLSWLIVDYDTWYFKHFTTLRVKFLSNSLHNDSYDLCSYVEQNNMEEKEWETWEQEE